ncbi:hypothetical protein EVJ58_g10463 [Rhodofomes roseus]|uniref:DUF6532 domain-containing protein n=1 Tax=Rhodofomes roseus TaxID=34475 RepID=A0A4Y9XQH8_9APHY|nr:hypothetical protein EVJ58_g10463 [Rhodofomes roseus]
MTARSVVDMDHCFSSISHRQLGSSQPTRGSSIPSTAHTISQQQLYRTPHDAALLGHMAGTGVYMSPMSIPLAASRRCNTQPLLSGPDTGVESTFSPSNSPSHGFAGHTFVASPAKRKRASGTNGNLLTPEQKKARKKQANDARLTLSDFKGCQPFYKMLQIVRDKTICHIATRNPFPDNGKKQGAGKQEIAAKIFTDEASLPGRNPNAEQLSTALASLLATGTDTAVYTALADAAETVVPKAYGLILSLALTNDEKAKNKQTAGFWLPDNHHFTHYDEEHEQWECMWQNPAICKVIQVAFFKNRDSLGCMYQEYFYPFSLELICLASDVIKHELTLWESTGERRKKADLTPYNRGRVELYQPFLKNMEKLKNNEVWELYRIAKFEDALEGSGFFDEHCNPTSTVREIPYEVMDTHMADLKQKMEHMAPLRAARTARWNAACDVSAPSSSPSRTALPRQPTGADSQMARPALSESHMVASVSYASSGTPLSMSSQAVPSTNNSPRAASNTTPSLDLVSESAHSMSRESPHSSGPLPYISLHPVVPALSFQMNADTPTARIARGEPRPNF